MAVTGSESCRTLWIPRKYVRSRSAVQPGKVGSENVVEVPLGERRLRIFRHVVDLSGPWRQLAAAIETLAESVDSMRTTPAA